MKDFLRVLAFIALTALSWGSYGPALARGGREMQGSHFRPFICVGVAYFVIAVAVPTIVLATRGEQGGWSPRGTLWSLVAGAAGAIGALGVILAFENGGTPLYVMPLVFGSAPVVNTFYTMAASRTYRLAGPVFYAGLILVIAGAAMVLVFKPTAPPPAGAHGATADLTPVQFALVALFVAMTGISWGVYGPILHKGQSLMQGSRLRPLLCVGIAYFVIAVIVPSVILIFIGEHGEFTFSGTLWSLAGGAAGAVGALGIIMAFNFGGKPIYVMPLVFGLAPVINTGVTMLTAAKMEPPGPAFLAGLMMVVVGAVTVLVFAPKSGPHAASRPSSAEPTPAAVS